MEFDKVTQKRIKDGNEELQFLVIGGDLSGIQSFIYNLGANKSGAKRLRARSFYIKTLSEVLSYRIIKDLELTPAHIVLQAGGKFHIIAPNTEDTTTKLKLIELIKRRSGYSLEKSTLPTEKKFNYFIWRSGFRRGYGNVWFTRYYRIKWVWR